MKYHGASMTILTRAYGEKDEPTTALSALTLTESVISYPGRVYPVDGAVILSAALSVDVVSLVQGSYPKLLLMSITN